MKAQATSSSARRRPTVIIALGAVAALGLGAVGWHFLAKPQPAAPYQSASASPASSYPIPTFARPEEARRYFDAMIQGDKRAIETIDTALARAKLEPSADAAYVQKLETLRAERATRLAAHVAAQGKNAAPR